MRPAGAGWWPGRRVADPLLDGQALAVPALGRLELPPRLGDHPQLVQGDGLAVRVAEALTPPAPRTCAIMRRYPVNSTGEA